ncbi:MAG: NAD-dependent epimerase/dehydratase family protein [Anaerolineales bacterium]|nr:NAD-dependent epimerase/dehydratase family protein [Chloroflexota bacterium]MBL6982316.1 NAD-dependent epimerase/dehydratase family protein [Anaerolineales bacterium]
MTITIDECLPRIKGSRVVVTGGAGFIGSHLVDYLVEKAVEQVVVIDNLTRPRLDWVKKKAKNHRVIFVNADITCENITTLFFGADVVFHLAAISRVMVAEQDPERTFAVNVMGTVKVAKAAHQAEIPRMVFTSSREVYGDPLTLPVKEDAPRTPKNTYGASKASAELYLDSSTAKHLEVVTLRLTNVYGPGDIGRVIPTFIKTALGHEPLVVFGGEQMLDFIWVGDVVEVLIKAAFSQKPPLKPVNVGSGVALPLRTLSNKVLTLTRNGNFVQIEPSRAPEVERFQADVTLANKYYGLLSPVDPLEKLPEVLRDFQ